MKIFVKIFALFLIAASLGCTCKEAEKDYIKDVADEEKETIQKVFERADSGDSYAQAYLGVLFYTGTIGRNYDAALEWFKKASENGSGEADYFISEMYEKGIRFEKDDDKAFKYLQSAASKAFTSARLRIAEMYLKGEREGQIKKDDALFWVFSYAEQGNETAKELIKKYNLKAPSKAKDEKAK